MYIHAKSNEFRRDEGEIWFKKCMHSKWSTIVRTCETIIRKKSWRTPKGKKPRVRVDKTITGNNQLSTGMDNGP